MIREYVVVLKNHEDLESFYEDMENPGGGLHIPHREVSVANRRPISRSTHYYLTDTEAEQIKNDPRVLGVELTLRDRGIVCLPTWEQTSNSWSKASLTSRANNNWGLLRCIEGVHRQGWGEYGTPSSISATIKTTSSGKNVDVVIVDGPINPSHPEFAKNPDGTGGSRVIEYDWIANHKAQVDPYTSRTNYQYGLYSNPTYLVTSNHGTNVAGILAGNTQGWARDANIYHISPYSDDPNFAFPYASWPVWLDYIRAWHRSKPVNPATGVRNPTITNHSYGFFSSVNISQITSIGYRGTVTNGPFTDTQLKAAGLHVSGTTLTISSYGTPYGSVTNDMIDLIREGVIVVHAAGNNNALYLTDTSHPDYNNYIIVNGETAYYYNRGNQFTLPQPGDLDTIVVGAIGAAPVEAKASYSNRGSRIDLFAPGSSIMGPVQSSVVTDLRNNSFYNLKYSGTSMASPQVAGVLACVAETWPRMNQFNARQYIVNNAKTGQITDTNGNLSDTSSLLGAPNLYLAYKFERPMLGQVGPKVNQGVRQRTGQLWPRTKIFRYGS